jgi:hypothetical protein
MILLGVITPICLLTGMTDVKYQAPKGEASLVNKYGDPMKIASTKNAGRLCRSQLELDYGSSLVESTINRQSTSFDQSRNMYLVTMNASVGTSDSWQQLEVNCHIKAQAITVNALHII